MAAKWVSGELGEDFTVDIFNDFSITLRGSDDISMLLENRKLRELSRETYLREIRRRGFIHESVDLEKEIEAIQNEPDLLDGMASGG